MNVFKGFCRLASKSDVAASFCSDDSVLLHFKCRKRYGSLELRAVTSSSSNEEAASPFMKPQEVQLACWQPTTIHLHVHIWAIQKQTERLQNFSPSIQEALK